MITIHRLSRIYWLEQAIVSYEDELVALREQAGKMSQVITGMPGAGPDADKLGRLVAQMAELREKIDAATLESRRLTRYIECVEDPQTRRILELRCCANMSWKAVAETVGGGNTESAVRMRAMRYLEKN